VREYHHEGGLAYWFMSATLEGATLINRCRQDQTYEARLADGRLPERSFSSSKRAEDA